MGADELMGDISGSIFLDDDGDDADMNPTWEASFVNDVGVSLGASADCIAIIPRFGAVEVGVGTSGCRLFRWRAKFPVNPLDTLILSLQ